eukprot:TRINITY_DN6314_c0_g1_i1.p1 TRINITY_DN6314_c0_g1~~TRINITY_DN6314_c0_g1_i1.p1  ORF type:complete len:272 (+),score=31.75 TRINITY_DN6314_c0_g1_i1:180-995(+)
MDVSRFMGQPPALNPPHSPRSPRPMGMSPRQSPLPHGTPRVGGRPSTHKSVLSRVDRQHQTHNTSVRPNHTRLELAQLTPSTPAQPQTQSLRTNHDDRARGPPSASLQKHGVVTPSAAATQHHNAGREEEGGWVTVFGFPDCEKEKTLQEFRRIGGVLREVYDGYNFAHIQYANPELVRRALDMNCRRHNGSDGRPFMIGVTECSEHDVALNQAMLSRPTPSQMSQAYIYNGPANAMDGFRHYQVDPNQDNRVALQEPTMLTKLGSFIFGA